MDLSVITVTWNSGLHIGDQIRSVAGAGKDLTLEHFVVDNASSDNTVSLIQKEFPNVRLIANEQNLGFAHANNQAVRQAQGEFILFFNPDMKLRPRSLVVWLEWLKQRPDVGLAGCTLTTPDGRIGAHATPRRFPRLTDCLVLFSKLPHLFPQLLNRYLMRDADWNKEQEVDSVHGSCMLVRRDLLDKLGRAFDERYFVWFEDVDLCREAKRLGYTVMYTPIVSAVDFGGQSFRQRNVLWKQWQFFRSASIYFFKWGA